MDPKDLRFTKSHEWIAADGTVGISEHAQHEITDVVFVELPKLGRSFKAEEACAVVESVKAAFDIYAPVPGTIAAVNEESARNPGLLNKSPYGDGWLYKIQMASPGDREKLMTHDQYQQFIKEK
jgi:glycine cleavage system H protein